MTAASAQQQVAQINTAFGDRPAVRVCANGSFPCLPARDVPVTFSAPLTGASGTFPDGSPGGSPSATVTSDSNGMAIAPVFTANGVADSRSYSMRIAAVEPNCYADPSGQNNPQWCAVPNFLFFTNSETAVTGATLISTGDGSLQAVLIGGTFGTSLNAIAFISTAPLVFAAGIPVIFTAPSTGPSGTFAATGTNTTTVLTGPTGVATASAFTGNFAPGDFVVNAVIPGEYTVSGNPLTTSFALKISTTQVNEVPYIVSAAAGSGQNAGTLTPFATNLQIAALDGSGNYVTSATTVFTAPVTGPSGTFADGSTTFTTETGFTGLATASRFTSNDIMGSYAVTVAVTKNGVTATGVIGLSNGRVKTTTTVSIEPGDGSVYGQPVVLTGTVRPQTGTLVPTAAVTFKSGSDRVAIPGCTGLSPSGGAATCTLHGLTNPALTPPGSYDFSADYDGDVISQPSISAVVPHAVSEADTTVALGTSAPTFSLLGDSITFTAIMAVTPPGNSGPPTALSHTGGITFTSSSDTPLNGGNAFPLVGGSYEAGVSTSALPVGVHQIIATYSGDSNFLGSSQVVTQNVYTVPAVTADPASRTVLAGTTASFTAAASGFPVPLVQWRVSADGGASFADIPSATAATYAFTAAVSDDQKQYQAVFTNPAGSATSAPATLTVIAPPAITSANVATFTVGALGSFSVTATGHPAPTLSVQGSLPGGVTFDAATGLLAGTPASGAGGAYPLTLRADNGVAPNATQSFILTVTQAPAITSASAATFAEGEAGNFSVTSTGYPTVTVGVAGALPTGVSFNPASQSLSGTPDAGTSGTYSFTFTAVNGIGDGASQAFTLTVNQKLTITSASATTFTVGSLGVFSVTTAGTPLPSIGMTGALPAGVTFADNGNGSGAGTLGGTPGAGTGGAYALALTAVNGVAPTATQSFSLTVNEAPAITSASAATLIVGASGTFVVTTTGYPKPGIFATGPLPGGVTLVPNGDGTATLGGTPAASGEYILSLTATNAVGGGATQTFTLTVNQAPAITSANATTFTVGAIGSFGVTATGYPAPVLSLLGTLPTGLTFDAATGLFAGTPAAGTARGYPLTLRADNGVTPAATQSFTLTVNQAPAITSANATTFSVGVTGTFTVSTTGAPTPSLTVAEALPAGVTFTDNVNGTATLSGAAAAGVYPLTVTAANGVAPAATQTLTLTISNAADVAVSITDAPDPVQKGGSLTYTIAVLNIGPGAAQSVTLSDSLPANTTFLSLAFPSDWTCPAAIPVNGTGTVTCATTALATGQTATFTLVVQVDRNIPQGTVLSNSAAATSATADPVPGNNAATATTGVGGTAVSTAADLSVALSDSPDPAKVGKKLTYEIRIANTGPGTATGVTLTDALPSTVRFESMSAPAAWTCTKPALGATGTVTCTTPSLVSGAQATIKITVIPTVPTARDGLSNTASVTSGPTDSNPSNNSATQTTTVTR